MDSLERDLSRLSTGAPVSRVIETTRNPSLHASIARFEVPSRARRTP